MLEKIKKGEADYHHRNNVAGGCVNGGGQPIRTAEERNNMDIPGLRAKAIYDTDAKSKLRKSHDNPVVKELYENYFGEPNSHKAHEILHTKYVKRGL